uniref:Tyr recombinase domain-containing protein n=1 Tax=Heterosigma akashiwo TaxID=2829 RepID=A0A6V1PQ41_HETAK|mmetsp:Transcript_18997/g.28717  ORF Transcript_18997/g.28717 Transcript_18997/m.28717 type:complete len:221 (+) Transcript_18997:344-1006(+)
MTFVAFNSNITNPRQYDRYWGFFLERLDSYGMPVPRCSDPRSCPSLRVFIKALADIQVQHSYKGSSMVTVASCINKFLKNEFDVDYMKKSQMKTVIRQWEQSTVARRAGVFTEEDMDACLSKPAANGFELQQQGLMTLGWYGLLRIGEIHGLQCEWFRFHDSHVEVHLPPSMTKTHEPFIFFIKDPAGKTYSVIAILKALWEAHPTKQGHFFLLHPHPPP